METRPSEEKTESVEEIYDSDDSSWITDDSSDSDEKNRICRRERKNRMCPGEIGIGNNRICLGQSKNN